MLSLYEKYKINSFNNFDDEIKDRYKNILTVFNSLSKENLPNILLYGNSGSGKTTILYSFFNNEKKKKNIFSYKTNTKTIEYILYTTKNFIEIDLKEFGIYKKYILRDIIKNTIYTKKVNNNKNKIIIIHNIHLLNIEDQFIMRKIIEDYIINCRFILLSNTINNLIEPIKSRCLILKTPGFTRNFIEKKLKYIINNENINIKNKVLKIILNNSETNLKKAILELNTYYNMTKITLEKNYIELKNYNINKIFNELFTLIKKTKLQYKKIDEILYKLLINYKLKPTYIINKLFNLLKIDNNKIKEIYNLNYDYNIKLYNSNKYIIYLQSYVYDLNNILNK